MLSETDVVLCDHCTLPVPAGLVEASAEHQFCCAGCRAVYETVHSCGLDGYYRLRDAASASLPQASPGKIAFETFDSPTFENLYVESINDNIRSVDLMLEGVTCAACVWLVEKLPQVLPGVIEARLSLRQSIVRITWDTTQVKLSRIANTLDQFGYPAHPARGQQRQAVFQRELRARLIKLGAAGAITGNLMLVAAAMYAGWWGGMEGSFSLMFRWISLGLGVLVLAWPGAEFFRSAYAAIRSRTINIDVPIVMALAAGGIAGVINVVLNRGEVYFDSLSMLVFLLLIGRFLQFRQQRRSEAVVELLFSMTPTNCRIVRDDTIETIPVEALVVNDVVEVLPGELLPADGVVETGDSRINQALLTGESAPVHVHVGDNVYGGSHNGAGILRVRVHQVGQSSRVGRLMRLIEDGLSRKPDIVRFADKVGTWFVGAVSIISVITFVYWSRYDFGKAVDSTVAFLIVTCPCVLGLATPMTIAVAIGQLARRDVLVKSATVIERLARGGELILDKTGTLTRGELGVQQWIGEESLRGVVAQIEAKSVHPIAKALYEAFRECEPPAMWRGAITEISDKGDGGVSAELNGHVIRIGSLPYVQRAGAVVPAMIECETQDAEARGQTVVLIAVDDHVVAAAVLSDALRDSAIDAIAQLRKMKFAPQICSGDAQPVVNHVANQLQIEAALAHGRMQPEDKLRVVRALSGSNVVMIGDGVNDAAALAAASVGIAVHGGAEASLAAADVYIARPGLAPVVDLVKSCRHAMHVIRRNFLISLGYNIFAGVLAATGIMNPLAAAIIMPVSSATVLFVAITSMTRKGRHA